MELLSRKEIKDLTDREVQIAHERILRDHSYGLLRDEVTPVENAHLLEEELRRRERSRDD